MDNIKLITTENISHLKNTYLDIGEFYLSRSNGNGSISEYFRDLSTLYTKASRNLDRLFEDGSFRGENSYNVVSNDLEIAYYSIMNAKLSSPLLASINEVIEIIDKVPVKN